MMETLNRNAFQFNSYSMVTEFDINHLLSYTKKILLKLGPFKINRI